MSKSTTRPVAKRKTRIKTDSTDRVKTAVCISPEAFKKLLACSIQEDMTQSEVIELLIGRTLNGYVVSLRGNGIRDLDGPQSSVSPAVSEDRHDLAGNVNAQVANAA